VAPVTHWYKNVRQNPSIRIDARGVREDFRAVPLTDAKAVKTAVEKHVYATARLMEKRR
jgi:F420H(2)-dependent quinone reductase